MVVLQGRIGSLTMSVITIIFNFVPKRCLLDNQTAVIVIQLQINVKQPSIINGTLLNKYHCCGRKMFYLLLRKKAIKKYQVETDLRPFTLYKLVENLFKTTFFFGFAPEFATPCM